MKCFSFLLALALLAAGRAAAQVSVELALDQEQFLQGESLPVAVKITNRSGRQLHFGEAADWLTFNVESEDGFVVTKNSEVPVEGEFDLESSQMGTKLVDLAPSFILSKPGRYKITATLRIKDLSAQTASAPKSFDIISGATLWSQDFGVPATNGAPVMRKFSLEQASYLHSQMRLYVQLSDVDEQRVFKTKALGLAVGFNRLEALVDRKSQLHVLWQSGAQSFNYCIVDADGTVLDTELYDDFNSRPHLTMNDSGNIIEAGGVRRPKSGELPVVHAPGDLPPAVPAPVK